MCDVNLAVLSFVISFACDIAVHVTFFIFGMLVLSNIGKSSDSGIPQEL